MPAPSTVDAYLEAAPSHRRADLDALRATIQAAAPEAEEGIAYLMPAYRSHGGQFVVSFGAYKTHTSLFPASERVVDACGDELTPYLSGKATIRFPSSGPIPLGLVTKIVKIRLDENREHAERRPKR